MGQIRISRSARVPKAVQLRMIAKKGRKNGEETIAFFFFFFLRENPEVARYNSLELSCAGARKGSQTTRLASRPMRTSSYDYS